MYTELTGLELEAIPTYTCDDLTGKVTTDYAYSLETTMANAGMGGGTDRNTTVTWPDMMISLAGSPSGTLTLVHQNAAGDFTVTVTFDGDTVMVTDGTTSVSHSLAEFLALSEPVAE